MVGDSDERNCQGRLLRVVRYDNGFRARTFWLAPSLSLPESAGDKYHRIGNKMQEPWQQDAPRLHHREAENPTGDERQQNPRKSRWCSMIMRDSEEHCCHRYRLIR